MPPSGCCRRHPVASAHVDYLVGASRMKLVRGTNLIPGTRVIESERLPSGPCHAVAEADDDVALCGAAVIEVFELSFEAETEFALCDECQTLIKRG